MKIGRPRRRRRVVRSEPPVPRRTGRRLKNPVLAAFRRRFREANELADRTDPADVEERLALVLRDYPGQVRIVVERLPGAPLRAFIQFGDEWVSRYVWSLAEIEAKAWSWMTERGTG